MNYLALGMAAVSAIVLHPPPAPPPGPSAFGVWVLASSVVAYLELFELGFGGATTKLVAEDAKVRPEQAVRMINTTFFVLVPMGVIALLAGVGIAFFFPGLVHVAAALHDQVIIVVAVLAVGLAVSIPATPSAAPSWATSASTCSPSSNASMGLATAVASIVVVVTGGGIVPLAIATTIISVLFQCVRLGHGAPHHPGGPDPSPAGRPGPGAPTRTSRAGSCSRPSWPATLAGDVWCVGIVLGVRPAAIYAVGAKLAKAANQGLDSLAAGLLPLRLGHGRNKGPGALRRSPSTASGCTLVGMLIGLLLSSSWPAPASGPGWAPATTPRPTSSSSWRCRRSGLAGPGSGQPPRSGT